VSEGITIINQSYQKIIDKVLLGGVILFFLWFFASSLSIAHFKSLQQDDAMFVTIPKNFLNGYGWATSYGEKIPFNPDISTGPSLLLPAAAMIAVFGTKAWIPAVTGAVMNIALTLLVLWQLKGRAKNPVASALALLCAISIFMVNDFKTFTAYYTGCLLFVFSLLFLANEKYSVKRRLLIYGGIASVGLYAKPLILISFMVGAGVVVFVWSCRDGLNKKGYVGPLLKYCFLLLVGFLVVLAPWHLYKQHQLGKYSHEFQTLHSEYQNKFFRYHGTGIGQISDANDKVQYIKKNTRKNFRIMSRFLIKENSFPRWLFFMTLIVVTALYGRKLLLGLKEEKTIESFDLFSVAMVLVILANMIWYVVFSFAMTPGHTFFFVFFTFFMFFLLLANVSANRLVGVLLCAAGLMIFEVRHGAMVEAYSFKAEDILINNQELNETKEYIENNALNYPLATCAYSAASWRLEFLLPDSENFLDCFHVYEDSLQLNEEHYVKANPDVELKINGKEISPTEHFYTQGVHREVEAQFVWAKEPDLTLGVEGLGFLGAVKAYPYVLQPVGDICLQNIKFRAGEFFVVCDVPFAQLKGKLDPTETARSLVDYQQWYKTRLKTY